MACKNISHFIFIFSYTYLQLVGRRHSLPHWGVLLFFLFSTSESKCHLILSGSLSIQNISHQVNILVPLALGHKKGRRSPNLDRAWPCSAQRDRVMSHGFLRRILICPSPRCVCTRPCWLCHTLTCCRLRPKPGSRSRTPCFCLTWAGRFSWRTSTSPPSRQQDKLTLLPSQIGLAEFKIDKRRQ